MKDKDKQRVNLGFRRALFDYPQWIKTADVNNDKYYRRGFKLGIIEINKFLLLQILNKDITQFNFRKTVHIPYPKTKMRESYYFNNLHKMPKKPYKAVFKQHSGETKANVEG